MFCVVLIFSGECSECLRHFLVFHSSQFPITLFFLTDEVKAEDSLVVWKEFRIKLIPWRGRNPAKGGHGNY